MNKEQQEAMYEAIKGQELVSITIVGNYNFFLQFSTTTAFADMIGEMNSSDHHDHLQIEIAKAFGSYLRDIGRFDDLKEAMPEIGYMLGEAPVQGPGFAIVTEVRFDGKCEDFFGENEDSPQSGD